MLEDRRPICRTLKLCSPLEATKVVRIVQESPITRIQIDPQNRINTKMWGAATGRVLEKRVPGIRPLRRQAP